MDTKRGGLGRISAVGRVVLAIFIAVAAVFAGCGQAAPVAYPVRASALATPDDNPIVTMARVQTLLGARQAARMAYLADWPIERLERLRVWLEYGIKVEGPWASEELTIVLEVVDAYAATYGEARFVGLVQAAVEAASHGLLHTLRLVRADGHRVPAAIWYGWSGRIRFADGLFDEEYFHQNYSWSFLSGEYAHPGPGVTTRHVVIGHEFGHVVLDGLRLEDEAAGLDRYGLEALYEQMIDHAQWPHKDCVANESMATEMAVWALGVIRTPQVDGLRLALTRYFPTFSPFEIEALARSAAGQ